MTPRVSPDTSSASPAPHLTRRIPTVDLVGIDFNSAHFSDTFNSSSGLLTVTDGTNTAHITFDDFNATLDFASDGNGGTLITDPPASSPSGDTTSAPADAGMKFENDRIDLGGSQPANQSGDAAGAKPSLVLQHNGDDTFVFHHELGAETGPAPQADAHEAADHPDVQLAQQLASLITPDPHSQAVFELIHNDILAPTLCRRRLRTITRHRQATCCTNCFHPASLHSINSVSAEPGAGQLPLPTKRNLANVAYWHLASERAGLGGGSAFCRRATDGRV